jgi:hypothetical protein
MAIDAASTKSLSGVWLRNSGAQLLGFLGANMTIGGLAIAEQSRQAHCMRSVKH